MEHCNTWLRLPFNKVLDTVLSVDVLISSRCHLALGQRNQGNGVLSGLQGNSSDAGAGQNPPARLIPHSKVVEWSGSGDTHPYPQYAGSRAICGSRGQPEIQRETLSQIKYTKTKLQRWKWREAHPCTPLSTPVASGLLHSESKGKELKTRQIGQCEA